MHAVEELFFLLLQLTKKMRHLIFPLNICVKPAKTPPTPPFNRKRRAPFNILSVLRE
jgi:hypothetical protein